MTMTLAKGGVYSQHGTCAIVQRGLMCGKPIKKDGFCNMHYTRKVRHGNVHAVKNMRGLKPRERFARSTVAIESGLLAGCTQWTMALDSHGYGRFAPVGTRTVLAHRWIYEQIVGPIPEGLTLDHECHNEAAARGECDGGDGCLHRRCVDVTHLAVKLLGENVMASANWFGNKTHCKRGHVFDEANTYMSKDGRRACRACHRDHERERQRRLREEGRP